MKKFSVGYTAGVYDLFHIGHINLLQAAKAMCDTLIVGVTTDEVALYKGKSPIIPFEQRLEIIKNISCVDLAVPQHIIDKVEAYERLHYDVLFVGDDWYGHESWKKYEYNLGLENVPVIYLPYTQGISTTELRNKIKEIYE
jgi:glycerol-3-phosphate cytidylyltransferase